MVSFHRLFLVPMVAVVLLISGHTTAQTPHPAVERVLNRGLSDRTAWSDAKEHFRWAIALAKEIHDPVGEALGRVWLTRSLLALQEPRYEGQTVVQLLRTNLADVRRVGLKREEAATLINLGAALAFTERVPSATALNESYSVLEEGLLLARQIRDQHLQFYALGAMLVVDQRISTERRANRLAEFKKVIKELRFVPYDAYRECTPNVIWDGFEFDLPLCVREGEQSLLKKGVEFVLGEDPSRRDALVFITQRRPLILEPIRAGIRMVHSDGPKKAIAWNPQFGGRDYLGFLQSLHGLQVVLTLPEASPGVHKLLATTLVQPDYKSAFKVAESALDLARRKGDSRDVAYSLLMTAAIYEYLEKPTQSLQLREEALPHLRGLGCPTLLAGVLWTLGELGFEQAEFKKALGFYTESAQYAQSGEEELREQALLGIGKTALRMSLPEVARGPLEEIIEAHRKKINWRPEKEPMFQDVIANSAYAAALSDLASVYTSLGLSKRGMDCLLEAEQSYISLGEPDAGQRIANRRAIQLYYLGNGGHGLELTQEIRAKLNSKLTDADQARILSTVGLCLTSFGCREEARNRYREALSFARSYRDKSIKDPLLRSDSLWVWGTIGSNLARSYRDSGFIDDALKMYAEVESWLKDITVEPGNLRALLDNGIGLCCLDQGKFEEARQRFEKSLLAYTASGDVRSQAYTWWYLAQTSQKQSNLPMAIFEMKQCLKLSEKLQGEAVGLGQEIESSFREALRERFVYLADLLCEVGRVSEAINVLALSKDSEFESMLDRDSKSKDVDLRPIEVKWMAEYEALSSRVAILAKQLENGVDDSVLEELKKAEGAIKEYLSRIKTAFAQVDADPARVGEIEQSSELGNVLSRIKTVKAVAIYMFATSDGVRMILQFGNARTVRVPKSNIPYKELASLITNFNVALQSGTLDPTPFATRLYDLLIRPIEADLVSFGADTLIWSMHDMLRKIPLGALWDSKSQNYFIEKFPCSLFTPATIYALGANPAEKWHGVVMGVSGSREVNGKTFRALPKAADEAKAAAAALGGKQFLDKSFTKVNLFNEMHPSAGNNVLHIISHFNFMPGDKEDTYLLLGEGTLSLSEFDKVPNLMSFIDLLILSACDTAESDDEDGSEFESMARIAQKNGAGSVIATLWPIDDQGASVLMKEFYRIHGTRMGLSKLETLRLAQLEMMRGKLDFKPDVGRAGAKNPPPDFGDQKPWVPSKERPIHPKYWAPFVLYGNFK